MGKERMKTEEWTKQKGVKGRRKWKSRGDDEGREDEGKCKREKKEGRRRRKRR